MSKMDSPEMQMVKEKRREIARERWRQLFTKWSWMFVLAEAFLLALHPPAATAALLIAVVLTGLRFRVDKDFKFRHLPFDVPAALFVLLSALSIAVSPDKGFSFYNWYNLVGVYVLTYFVVGQNLRSLRQVKELLVVLAMAAAAVILYGFYQFAFGIDISAMKWVDGDAFPELRKRVFSTWENPNILAGYLDIIICMVLGMFVKAGSKQKRIVLGVLLVAATACLAMTYARGALLVIGLILALYGMFKDWRILAACVAVAAVLLVADPVLYERLTSVFTKVDTSSEMRLAFWESTVAMIQDHPFLGIGWGAYWMVYPEYDFYLQGADILIVHAHNWYLNYAAEIGIPGMLAFVWLFFGSLVLALRQKFLPPQPVMPAPTPFDYNAEAAADVELKKISDSVQTAEEQPELPIWKDFCQWTDWDLLGGAALGLGLALVSVALNGFTDDLLFNIPTSMFLWMLLAFIAAVAEFNRPTEAELEEIWADETAAAETTAAPVEAEPVAETPAAEPAAVEKAKAEETQPEAAEVEEVKAEETQEEAEDKSAKADEEELTLVEKMKADMEQENQEKEEVDGHEKSDNHIKGDH